MSYFQNGLIQASDYNTIANSLNLLWGVGAGDKGLGQVPIQPVGAGSKVTADQWNALINVANNLADHQGPGSPRTEPTYLPTAGTNPDGTQNGSADSDALVRYLSEINSNLTTLTANRLNASGQTSERPINNVSTERWSTQAKYTFTVSFNSGDGARFFFNTGGQIAFTFAHPNGGGMDNMFALLCQQIGTITMSAVANSPSTTTIAGIDYTGIQQNTDVGGGASPDVLQTGFGYYGLTTSSVCVFKQRMNTGFYADYLGSSIAIYAKTNGTQGRNGDNGNIITFEIVWSEVPPTLYVSAGSTNALTLKRLPTSQSYVTKSFGTPSVHFSSSYS